MRMMKRGLKLIAMISQQWRMSTEQQTTSLYLRKRKGSGDVAGWGGVGSCLHCQNERGNGIDVAGIAVVVNESEVKIANVCCCCCCFRRPQVILHQRVCHGYYH